MRSARPLDTLRVYLIRHGETTWNAEGRLQGRSDVPLSPVGVRQSELLAMRLRDESLEAIYASDLRRSLETAAIVGRPHGLSVECMRNLTEIHLGDWEGSNDRDIVASGHGDVLARYRADPVTFRPPGSEPMDRVVERMLAALAEVRERHPVGTVAIVGHGGSLRVLLAHAIGVPPVPALFGFRLDNGSLSLIEYGTHRSWVRFVNDTCHLRVLMEQEQATDQ